ncbi:GntR family transcriptional regulator [Saccharopolyspora mangrovi]|uniref:GntR family transcriptional regulator n=1 Tax=Saccharopolyspora mangrovi TaxID=3082379 RepID=A0ABU6AEU2_9PSEU|nr:GntR family transcriptional regulator [Saccharopolyspora sp. S2-29]MEB3370060.1 GntR family transcriptional regulator [Saccharopolyspora sp. S2-29]
MTSANAEWQSLVATARPAPALGRHVVDYLRRMIIVGKLLPGTHLVESQLSKTFDVSRGPVRDALRQLEVEGLVESRRRGVFVIGLSPADIDELYQLREVLESHAVQQCMSADSADFTEIQGVLERMSAAAAAQDAAAFADADLDFHTGFYKLAGNRRIDNVWQQYRPTFADMLTVTNAEDRDLTPTYRDHVELLDAIVAGEQQRALELLQEHIAGSRTRLLTAYTRFLEQEKT